jgi:hypothetical protein
MGWPDSYQQCGRRDWKGEVVGKLRPRLSSLTHFSVVLLALPPGSGRKSRRSHHLVCHLPRCGFYMVRSLNSHSRLNGGPGCSSLEGSFQENGVSYLQLNPKELHLIHLSPFSGNVVRLCLRQISGAGPIFPQSCILSNLLAPVIPKERQMRKYAFSVLSYLHDVVFSVRAMAG